MIGYNINSDMPPIAVAVGCSSTVTLDLTDFAFENNKLIFSIKSSALKDAPVLFSTVITESDLDEDNYVEITIDEDAANMLTEKSFYTFTTESREGIFNKITDNGRIVLQYGAYKEPAGQAAINLLNADDISEFRW